MPWHANIAARIFGPSLAIEHNALRAILDGPAMRRIVWGEAAINEENSAKIRASRSARLQARAQGELVGVGEYQQFCLTEGGIAVVPVQGILSQKFDFMSAWCGWTTYEGLEDIVENVAADARVKGVLLDVESPGGETVGMLDACDALIELNGIKPVWAVANGAAYSAAYAIAASSENLCVPRLAGVGSIGAVTVHLDESGSDEKLGLKYTATFSGARKIDGWEHAPLSTEAKAAAQGRVDHCRDQFAELVGRQGRISKEQALATEAGIFLDQFAVEAGLANEIASFDEALAKLTQAVADRSPNYSR